jgi:transcriptional regulator with XRE-family HTH domain
MDDSRQQLGDRLREERERLGLAQGALAERAGVTRKTQYSYEQGVGSPDAQYLVSAAGVGIDVVYVLTGARGGPEVAELFRAAAQATLTAESPDLAESYVAAAISQGGVLTEDELALLGKFRNLPAAQRESFLELVGALATRRGARTRSGPSQVIHGNVGQVLKAETVIGASVVMGESKPRKAKK